MGFGGVAVVIIAKKSFDRSATDLVASLYLDQQGNRVRVQAGPLRR